MVKYLIYLKQSVNSFYNNPPHKSSGLLFINKSISMKIEKNIFIPDEELLAFANQFSKLWRKLSAGDKIPSVFSSDKGKYTVYLYDKLYNKLNYDIRDAEFFPEQLDEQNTVPKESDTSAIINHTSLIIELSKSRLLKQDASENYIFFLILWLMVEKEIKKTINSDKITLDYYATTGREFETIIIGYIGMYKHLTPNSFILKRIKLVKEIATEYENKN